MIHSIKYFLPANPKVADEFSIGLGYLLGTEYPESSMPIPLDEENPVYPETIFNLDPKIETTTIRFGNGHSLEMPESFLPDRARNGTTLSLFDAATSLVDRIVRLDHTGLIVPNDVPPEDWQDFTNALADNTMLVDYPHGIDGYDSAAERWLFVIPRTSKELLSRSSHLTTIRRQPKFELVWNPQNTVPVLQMDLETTLTRAEIIEKFPDNESFDVTPELGQFFRSVNITLPFKGLRNGRLDLRYKDDGKPNEWNTAELLIKQGQRVWPNNPATSLPAPPQPA